MTTFLGMNFPTPDITGLLSQSWIYIAIILVIIVIGCVALAMTWFFLTYSWWVEVYENIGGGNKMVKTIRTRARKVKVSSTGEELLQLWRPRVMRTAYGRRIAPKTYAFGVGLDGYWYNMTMGDLDTQLGILDVEPIDRDVRMMHVAVEKIIQENYNPYKNVIMTMTIFLIVMIIIAGISVWIIVGKVGSSSADFSKASDKLSSVVETLTQTESIQAQTTQLLITHGYPSPNLNTPIGLAPANATTP